MPNLLIPLAGRDVQDRFPDAQGYMNLRDLSTQSELHKYELLEAKQNFENQQKIQQLSQQPGAIDPQTGFWSPTGLLSLGSISPQYAQKAAQQRQAGLMQLSQMRQANVQEQVNLGLLDKRENEQRSEASQTLNEVWANTYDQIKKAGGSEEIAAQKAEEALQNEFHTMEKSGRLQFMKQGEREAVLGQKRDITSVRARMPRKELKAEEDKATAQAAAEETPFIKELKARGVKPGSAEWKSELKKHANKQEGLTVNLGPPISSEGLESAASQAATGQPLTQVVPGYGNAAAQKREQVRQGAIRQIMKDNPGMTPGEAGTELANRATDYVAGRRSVTQLVTMQGATKQAVAQLEFNINKTAEMLKKIPSSNLSPVINAIIRGEEKWTGDPKYSELFYYMSATAQESARILQGGQASVAQLHAGAAEEARKWANVNMTPKMFIEGVAPAMLAEGRFRLKSYDDAIRSQQHRPEIKVEPPKSQPPKAGMPYDDPEKEKRYQEWRKSHVKPPSSEAYK